MSPRQLSATKRYRILCTCLYAALLCSSFAAVSDSRGLLNTNQLCTALDMSTDDCALITSISTTPSGSLMLPTTPGGAISIPTTVPWTVSNAVARQGSSSLRSGNIGHLQASCLVLAAALPADTLISFSLRTSSDGGFDRLVFAADNQLLIENFSAGRQNPTIDPLRDWEQLEYRITDNISTMTWCYLKDGNKTVGDDRGWLDELFFTPATDAPLTRDLLCPVLDMNIEDCALITSVSTTPPANLTFPLAAINQNISVPTTVPWVVSNVARQGTNSLRSGDIEDSQASCLVLGVTLPPTTLVRFSLRGHSQGLADRLVFAADNQLSVENFSAGDSFSFRDWEQFEYRVTNSLSNLSWCYLKDSGVSSGNDSGWLDRLDFVLTDQGRICMALDITADNCAMIQSVSYDPPQLLWVITSETSVAGNSSLRSANIGHDQRSCLVLELELPANSVISVAGRTSSEGGADQLQIVADNLRLDTVSAMRGQTERDWRQQSYFLPANISTLSWCYARDSTGDGGADAVWIDRLGFSTSNISYQDRICAALDIAAGGCAMIQSVSYDPPQLLWVITSETSVVGDSSLRSGDIDDDQDTCLNLALALPADTRIRFWRRLNFQASTEMLHFVTNSQELGSFTPPQGSIAVEWQQEIADLTTAVTTLRWCYAKDGSISQGDDSAWIDALTFIPAEIDRICETLDLSLADRCAIIRSVTYDPPQNPWLATTTEFIQGGSALISPPLEAGQSSCLTVEFNILLAYVAFEWRVTSLSAQDILRFQTENQQRQIHTESQWQTEFVDFSTNESTLRWCYSFNSKADSQTARAWLDSLFAVATDERYVVQIAVTDTPTILAMPPDSFRFQVTVTARSTLLPTPADWVLVASYIDNISGIDNTYSLVFSGNSAQVDVTATPDNPGLPSSILFALEERPLLRGVAATSLTVELPARELTILAINVPAEVTQTAIGVPLEIAVTVNAADNLGFPVEPAGLTLVVSDSGNANVPQSTYALTFASGMAQTTITVELTARGLPGSIELSVIGSSIEPTVRVTLNPFPRVLVSITLAAANTNLVQTTANTAVNAVLILSALDNYGDPIEAENISLQLSASNDAIVVSSLTVTIEASGSAQQAVEILLQNDLDTTVTVQILRGNLDEAVQLLPEGGIQIEVRALRVLRRLQLSLTGAQSPLRQIDGSLPIRAQLQLIGLDQYAQPIAFTTVTLTATADPSTTQVTLNPPQLEATEPERAVTLLVVTFSAALLDTTITIAITNTSTGVTTNNLVLRALPDRRPPLQPLFVDTDTSVSELDLIVAMRWLANPQRSTESLVFNLTVTSASITAAGINYLRQLFNENSDRVDLNKDGRADQLDLRILLRYMSGLRGAELAEQEVIEDIVRLLLGKPPNIP